QKYHIDRNLSSNKCHFHTQLVMCGQNGTCVSMFSSLYRYSSNDEAFMANVVTINRQDVVALIEEAAKHLTGGNKTEAVALGMRRLLDQEARSGSLFGAHPGSVRVREGVDLIASALDVEPDAETGREIAR